MSHLTLPVFVLSLPLWLSVNTLISLTCVFPVYLPLWPFLCACLFGVTLGRLVLWVGLCLWNNWINPLWLSFLHLSLQTHLFPVFAAQTVTEINAGTHRGCRSGYGTNLSICFNTKRKRQSMNTESSHNASICCIFTSRQSTYMILLTSEPGFRGDT